MMHIKRLRLTQFRNYTELDLSFSSAINCLVGSNGAGKTNVLDALHYLAFTRGFRSSQDQQAVQRGAEFFVNMGSFHWKDAGLEVASNFVKGKGKKILLNGKAQSKLSEHIGRVPMIVVLPQDAELISGPSALRRRFLDMLIAQYDPAYLQSLIAYDRLLAQRNALLKSFGEAGNYDPDYLSIFDEQLLQPGIVIRAAREAFLDEYHPIFASYFAEIVAEAADEVPKIRYRASIEDNTPEGWRAAYASKAEKDRVNQYTSIGVHRDELVFSINGASVRNFGSQGQQKTFVIALKLAQYALLERHAHQQPILLLDDIFDKLDEHRLGQIVQLLNERISGQVFITDTSYERLFETFARLGEREVRYFMVDNGSVNQLETAEQ
ncbi:MAG: DNA replication/repair protein RecF [Bacteroidota bacterium]